MDRRGAPRLALAAEAVGQWELSTEGFPLSVSDVSAAGIGVVIDKSCEVGQRLRISFDGETQDADTITAKTVRQREVAGQYLVGCTILKGAPYLFLNRSVEMKCRQAVRKNRVYLGTLCIRIVDIYILATNFCLRWDGCSTPLNF